MKKLRVALGLVVLALLTSCATIPKGGAAVSDLEIERYLGKWYEIARYDFVFEKGLFNTTAEYSLRSDGLIGVTNRGKDEATGEWKTAKGVARQRRGGASGELEVSFFGPFFAAYNVVRLDPEYRYALVAGASLKYLWILSREPSIPDEVKESYLDYARGLGYDLGGLVWVRQE